MATKTQIMTEALEKIAEARAHPQVSLVEDGHLADAEAAVRAACPDCPEPIPPPES